MCTESIAKIILIVINVVFFIAGGAILAVGIIAYVKEDLLYDITDLLTDKLSKFFEELDVLASIDLDGLIKNNAIIIIVVGAVLFGIGFFGCCGAMRKNGLLLNIYAIIVLVILAAEVGLGVYAYMYSDKLEGNIQDGLQLSMVKYYKEGARFNGNQLVMSNEGEELSWDTVQLEAVCCGVSDWKDWAEAGLWNTTYVFNGVQYQNVAVPPSCCIRTDDGRQKEFNELIASDFTDMDACLQGTVAQYNDKGCYSRIRSIIFDNQKIIIGVFIIIILVEILGISCACYLKNKADK